MVEAMLLRRIVMVMALAVSFPARANWAGFSHCADFKPEARALCGTIGVPEDRSRAGGRVIDLNVVVLKAASPTKKAPLFMLAGGPGQAATDLAEIALGPYARVRETRDVVLVDQRGTGGSNRLDCLNGSDKDPRRAFGALFDPVDVAACRKDAAAHADARLYSTEPVIADLEEVRATLGYERVVLWGGSGGTRTAQAWLRAHPERIEAVALDGVVSMDLHAPSGYARGSQDALDRVFADCAAQASCNAAYPDLRAEFRKLLHRFDGGPITAAVAPKAGESVSVMMRRGDFTYAVRGMLYGSNAIAALPKAIHEAAQTGNLDAFAQFHWQRDSQLRPTVAMGAHLAVFCTEDVPFIDRRAIPDLTRGTFIGRYLIDQYTEACRAWDSPGALTPGFHVPVRSTVPVLLLSGYYDPSTPPHVAGKVAQTLVNSWHIIVRNEAHGAGFGCAREGVETFLVSGSLEGLGPVCDAAGPIIFEAP